MQPLVIILLIGTAFAMVNAAPAQNKLQSLQAILEGDDDQVKAQIFDQLASQMQLAELQETDEGEAQKFNFGKLFKKFGKKLGGGALSTAGGALAGLALGGHGGEEEQPAKLAELQETDEGEAQKFNFGKLFKKFGKKLGGGALSTAGGALAGLALGGHGGEEEQPAKLAELQETDEGEAQKFNFGKLFKKFGKKLGGGALSTAGGALAGLALGGHGGEEEQPAKLAELQETDEGEAQKFNFGKLFKKFGKKLGGGALSTAGGALAGLALGGHGGEEEQPAKLAELQEDNDDDDAMTALLDAIQERLATMQENDDDDDMAEILSFI